MNTGYSIDINCDMGEGLGNEAELLPYVSSCNIACGGHAGDEATIRRVATEAFKQAVKVGAHPSYPDRDNFGRISMQIERSKLQDSLEGQVMSFHTLLRSLKIPLHHIKPHGALYNDIAAKPELATCFLESIDRFKNMVSIYLPYGSKAVEIARERGFRVCLEAFADRNYNEDLSLVSRKKSNAIIGQPQEVLQHLIPMVKKKALKSVSGAWIEIQADTFCVHGDTPSALQILMYLSGELPKHQIEIKK